MIVFRRRLLYWLIKAYIKKWGKAILFYFFVGLLIFFFIRLTYHFVASRIPLGKKELIGMVGAHTLNNLPPSLLYEVSSGLTYVPDDGLPKPDIAKSWKIYNEGKAYVFYLSKDRKFSDGKEVTSDTINYNFLDAQVLKPNKDTIVFKLKESFAPFLVTVSRPIFKNGFQGVGEYEIKDLKLNGNFVGSITLSPVSDPYKTKTYQFYPTLEALKTAYALGEVTTAKGLLDTSFDKTSFALFPNTFSVKKTNYDRLVTLFYNTTDAVLSDKKVRSALSYAIPDDFSYGKRAHSPISPKSFFYADFYDRREDLIHARLLLSESNTASKGANVTLTIKVLPQYRKTADKIANNWKQIGITTKIEEVQSLPSVFQIFLGDFNVPRDPDQYSLWHSSQDNNITNYKNLRIDKFLEDGRKTMDINSRKKIYFDFQKYLLDDTPASFLYFPYEYEITRK